MWIISDPGAVLISIVPALLLFTVKTSVLVEVEYEDVVRTTGNIDATQKVLIGASYSE